MAGRSKEPSTAPQNEQWYPLVLGSSFKDQPSKRFYSLRYEFKPASIDTSRPGTLHKGAENKVTVELANNIPGKPKVSFQGISEDCKDSDAILFFDGRTLRLEKLHRAVKTLRHVRQPGESAASVSASVPALDNRSPLHLNGAASEDNNVYRGPRDHVEEIVVGSQPEPQTAKKNDKKPTSDASKKSKSSPKKRETSPLIDVDDELASKKQRPNPVNEVEHIDINVGGDEDGEHESEYEIEDVELSEEEDGQVNTQVEASENKHMNNENNENKNGESSSETGSSSSESGSESSSGSDASDDESASLGEI